VSTSALLVCGPSIPIIIGQTHIYFAWLLVVVAEECTMPAVNEKDLKGIKVYK
jgi:hypothetical protein